MTTTPRQWRVFVAQLALTVPAAVGAVILLPSWWAVLPVPAAWLLPALLGAALDTRQEKQEARARWIHPSSGAFRIPPQEWDTYFDVPQKGRPW